MYLGIPKYTRLILSIRTRLVEQHTDNTKTCQRYVNKANENPTSFFDRPDNGARGYCPSIKRTALAPHVQDTITLFAKTTVAITTAITRAAPHGAKIKSLSATSSVPLCTPLSFGSSLARRILIRHSFRLGYSCFLLATLLYTGITFAKLLKCVKTTLTTKTTLSFILCLKIRSSSTLPSRRRSRLLAEAL